MSDTKIPHSKPMYPHFPVLLVDDEESWLKSFQSALRASGVHNVVTLSDSREVLDTLNNGSFCAVAIDLMMPYINGEELIPQILSNHPELPLLVISGLDQVRSAVNCVRLGAFDFIVKTEPRSTLIAGVKHAIEIFELRQENSTLREHFFSDTLNHPEHFAETITADKKMTTIFQYVEAIAQTSRSVLITGESGVGKENIARSIHFASARSGQFIAVNMAGLDDNMVADTLFGHKKGAFTGATTSRAGLVESAKDGTLFLDEIGDLSLESQKKLLRLLQENEYTPLGSDLSRKSSCRIVAATHCDLQAMQQQGTFRRDLYFRLRGHILTVPPLRNRRSDIPLLIHHFVTSEEGETTIKVDSNDITRLLYHYDFPGNIRELQLIIQDALCLMESNRLTADTVKKVLLFEMAGVKEEPPDVEVTYGYQLPSLKEARTLLIEEALRRTSQNQAMAAQLIGVSRQAINRYVQERKGSQ